jgi:hypothetical protein
VLQHAVSAPSAEPILRLGFRQSSSRGVYEHPDLPFTLEFLPAPLAVGANPIESWDTMREQDRVLFVISPLDCTKDRMAAAIHWKDPDSARQAAAVARAQGVDVDELRGWCVGEGGKDAMVLFDAYYERLG